MANFYQKPNTDYYFIKSNDINVFPCAYRGSSLKTANNRVSFDPESRLSTEQSFLKLSNIKHKNSYVVGWDTNNNNTSTHKLEFVLGGYYFIIKSIESLAHKFAYIAPVSKDITNTDSTDVLGNLYDGSDVTAGLDKYITDTDDYYFVGICFTDTTPSSGIFIELPGSPTDFTNHKSRFGLNSSDIKSNYETKAITGNLVNGGGENSIASLYSTVDSSGQILTTNNLNTASGINSIALGESTSATALSSYAEGAYTSVEADYGHAEGYNTHVRLEGSGIDYPHAAHAEGRNTKATGVASHAEGGTDGEENPTEQEAFTIASGDYSHAEGNQTAAQGLASHAEGQITQAIGIASHAEGYHTEAHGLASHAEGGLTATDINAAWAHAEGHLTTASGPASHAEGDNTKAFGSYAHAEGQETSTGETATASHAEGISTQTGANANAAHAEGYYTKASGTYSHAEGDNTTAQGIASHVEGNQNLASGNYSHAEGKFTTASNTDAHAEGFHTKATAVAAHAEGGADDATTQKYVEANGTFSHAEGWQTVAKSKGAHAEGYNTTAGSTNSGSTANSGYAAHAEGYDTIASGDYSHAEGYYTTASGAYQHVFGKYNTEDNTKVEIVGNGTANNARSNARTLDWDGNEWTKGAVSTESLGIHAGEDTNKVEIKYDSDREVISFTFK